MSLPDRQHILQLVREVGLEDDILRFGLNTVVPQGRWPVLVPHLLRLRQIFHGQWGGGVAELVEFFDVMQFLRHRTLYGNIVFGDPEHEEYELDNLPKSPTFIKLLRDTGLYQPLLDLGKSLIERTVRLSKELDQDLSLLENIPITADQFEQYRELKRRIYGAQLNQLTGKDNQLLLRLALQFIPAEHQIVKLPPSLEEKILTTRHKFIQDIAGKDLVECQFGVETDFPGDMEGKMETADFSVYCPAQYLYSKSILDNVLFGRVRREQPQAQQKVQELVVGLLKKENLLDEVLDIGLDFQVGSKGDRLTGGQKQKVALIRALLKEPPILILDEATASLDNASQARIQRLLETDRRGKCTVVAVVHQLDTVAAYDQIAVLKDGKLVERGTYEQLMAAEGVVYKLKQGILGLADAAA